MLSNIKRNCNNCISTLIHNKWLFVAHLTHLYVYGSFFAQYLWLLFFDILAIHLIVINIVVGAIAIFSDVRLYFKLKEQYYDSFSFNRNLTLFLAYYIAQIIYLVRSWFVLAPESLIFGYIFGYSHLILQSKLLLSAKSIGGLILILSFLSTMSFSKTGYSNVIPGWNRKIFYNENFFLAYIVSPIITLGALVMSSFIDQGFDSFIILCVVFFIGSLFIIPIYYIKFNVMANESIETIKMLNSIKKRYLQLFWESMLLVLSVIFLLVAVFLNDLLGAISLIFSFVVLMANRIRQIGIIVKEQTEESIENISYSLFNFS